MHSRSYLQPIVHCFRQERGWLFNFWTRVFFRPVFHVRLCSNSLYTECSFSPGGLSILRPRSDVSLRWLRSLPAASSSLGTFGCFISTAAHAVASARSDGPDGSGRAHSWRAAFLAGCVSTPRRYRDKASWREAVRISG